MKPRAPRSIEHISSLITYRLTRFSNINAALFFALSRARVQLERQLELDPTAMHAAAAEAL